MISHHHPFLLLSPLLFFSPFLIKVFVFLLSPNSFHTVSLFSHVISRSFLHSLPFHFSASALSCPANFQPPPSRFFWPLHLGVAFILSLSRIVIPTINRISSVFFLLASRCSFPVHLALEFSTLCIFGASWISFRAKRLFYLSRLLFSISTPNDRTLADCLSNSSP